MNNITIKKKLEQVSNRLILEFRNFFSKYYILFICLFILYTYFKYLSENLINILLKKYFIFYAYKTIFT